MKNYFLKSWKIIFFGILICLLQLFLGVRAQLYTGKVLDQAMQQHPHLGSTLFYLLLFSTGSILMSFFYMLCRSRFGQSITKLLRDDVFKSLLRYQHADFIQKDRGEVLALYTKQISLVEREYLFMLAWLAEMLLKIVYVIATLAFLDPLLGLLSVLIFAVPMLLPKFAEAKLTLASTKRLEKMQAHLASFNSWLKGFELIKNYAIEQEIQEQFAQSNKRLVESEEQAEKTYAQTNGWSFTGTMGAQALLVMIAGIMVFRNSLSPGDFIVVMGLVTMLKAPIYWVAKLIQYIISTKPTRDSLLEFISYQEPQGEGLHHLSVTKPPRISFNQVDFGYGEETLLKDLHLSFEPGKRYLITGESGCGKSSLVNILLSNLPYKQGEVLLDNHRIERIDNLRDLFSVARQDAVLFDDSLLHNLTLYDNSISKERIFKVLGILGLEKFAHEEGLQRRINPSGTNLSGGEKKRISLARSLLREAPVVILDEPLANIDAANVNEIEDMLLNIQGKTLILISHQFSAHKLHKFDGIYKIKGGTAYETLLAQA